MPKHMFNPLALLNQTRQLLTLHDHWRPGMAAAITGDITEFLDRFSPVRPDWPTYDELRTAIERIAHATAGEDNEVSQLAAVMWARFNRPLEDAKTVRLRDAAEQAATILTNYLNTRTSKEGGMPAGLSPLLGALADLRGALIPMAEPDDEGQAESDIAEQRAAREALKAEATALGVSVYELREAKRVMRRMRDKPELSSALRDVLDGFLDTPQGDLALGGDYDRLSDATKERIAKGREKFLNDHVAPDPSNRGRFVYILKSGEVSALSYPSHEAAAQGLFERTGIDDAMRAEAESLVSGALGTKDAPIPISECDHPGVPYDETCPKCGQKNDMPQF